MDTAILHFHRFGTKRRTMPQQFVLSGKIKEKKKNTCPHIHTRLNEASGVHCRPLTSRDVFRFFDSYKTNTRVPLRRIPPLSLSLSLSLPFSYLVSPLFVSFHLFRSHPLTRVCVYALVRVLAKGNELVLCAPANLAASRADSLCQLHRCCAAQMYREGRRWGQVQWQKRSAAVATWRQRDVVSPVAQLSHPYVCVVAG